MKATFYYTVTLLIGIFIGGAFMLATYKSEADYSQGLYDCYKDVESFAIDKRNDIDLSKYEEVK